MKCGRLGRGWIYPKPKWSLREGEKRRGRLECTAERAKGLVLLFFKLKRY